MTNKEKGEARANEIDRLIIEALSSGRSFRVEAGAGSGKTYSLMKVIDWLEQEKRKELIKKGQKVACLTYTNVAVDEIKSRLKSDGFIKPSTIHNFAWNCISRFQPELILQADKMDINVEKTRKVPSKQIKKVLYDLGVRYFENGELHIHHDDVIKLFVALLDNAKFRKLLSNQYSIILIDEYQDSFKSIMDQFLKYFIESKSDIQIGLFGDAWQTIYSDLGACGDVFSQNIEVISKGANFRSEEIIVNALNRIRPELQQISAIDEHDGEIIVITTNDYTGERQKGYYNGELPNDILFTYIEKVRDKLSLLGWSGECKTLMLTHKMLAKQQHYYNLFEFLGDHLREADDEHFLFFMKKVEPVFDALQKKNAKSLIDALGVESRPIQSPGHKTLWNALGNKLKTARKGSIYDVLKVLENSKIFGLPPKIAESLEMFDSCTDDKSSITLHGKPINQFYSIMYSEVLNAIDFKKEGADYSTNHGVKGEGYENVILVIGRGWNNYKFDEFLPMNTSEISNETLSKSYIRNRNLFYVCCSRAKKRLALFITVPVNDSFMEYLENVFSRENIISYGDFMNLN